MGHRARPLRPLSSSLIFTFNITPITTLLTYGFCLCIGVQIFFYVLLQLWIQMIQCKQLNANRLIIMQLIFFELTSSFSLYQAIYNLIYKSEDIIFSFKILPQQMGMCLIAKQQDSACSSGKNELSKSLKNQIRSQVQNSTQQMNLETKTAYFQKTKSQDISLSHQVLQENGYTLPMPKKRRSLLDQKKARESAKFETYTVEKTSLHNSNQQVSQQTEQLTQFSFQRPNYSVEDYNILNEVGSEAQKQLILATIDQQKPVALQTIMFKNGSSYKGQWLNAKRHGKGRHVNGQGVYEGSWESNQMVGYGTFQFNNKDKYEGQFLQSMMHGKGKYEQHTGIIYEGQFRLNKKYGFGIQVYDVGEYYQGQWKDGYKNGKGLLQFSDGSFVKGNFQDNYINGYAEYYWAGKKRYKGEWVLNKIEGFGIMEWEDGRRYEGHYVNDKMEGNGVYSFKNGQKFTGVWKYNKKNGKGEYMDETGNTIKGLWYEDRLIESYGLASKKRFGITSMPK